MYFPYIYLFAHYNIRREMVTIAIHEFAVRECSERIALILSFLRDHKRSLEHSTIMTFLIKLLNGQRTFRRMEEVIVHHNYVEYAPHVTIGKRTEAIVKHLPEWVKEPARLHFLGVSLSSKPFRHALVERVVVHVPHDNDLYSRVLFHHPLGILPHRGF